MKKQMITGKNLSVADTLKYKFLDVELNSIRKSLIFSHRDYDLWHPGISGVVNNIYSFWLIMIYNMFILQSS